MLVSLPALDGDFLADDFAYLRLGPRPLRDFLRFGDLTEEAWGGSRPLDEPRPLFVLSYKLDAALHGANPAGFHATNLALHVACCLALFLLAELLAGLPAWTPLLAGLLFAVAPAHAEPIVWITGRVDMLSTLFFLAAFVCYLRHDRGRRALDRWLALFAFALGLLSKETVATLPVVLLAWEAARAPGAALRERAASFLRRAKDLTPFLAALGLYAVLRLSSFGSIAREERLGLPRVLDFLGRQLYYVEYLILPLPGIVSDAAVSLATQLLAGAVLAILAAAALALLGTRSAQRREVFFFGIVFHALTILPLVMTYRSARHLYMPSVGFAIAVAFLLLPPRATLRPWRFAAAAFLVALFAWELRAREAPWLAAEDVSRRARAGIEALSRDLPKDAVVLLPDIPLSKDGVLGWDFALPFALEPPFLARNVTAAIRLLEHPGLYCCPTPVWWRERRPILEGLVAEGGGPRELVLLTWNPGRGAMVRHRARLAPAALRSAIEEALGRKLESLDSIDEREGARLVQALALAVRRAD